jgi:hypothetical protein
MTTPSLTHLPALIVLLACATLVGCEQLGIDDPVKVSAAKQAEGRAIGSGCRHSGRALEDCYGSNPKVSKAMIFEGWREMDAYMRENKIETMAPPADEPLSAKAGGEETNTKDAPAEATVKGAEKSPEGAGKADKAAPSASSPAGKPQAKGVKLNV